jgi:hypothetical protein
MKHEQKTYGKGWSITVDPSDRAADVLHYLICGTLLGGRSLDGVTWEENKNKELEEVANNRAKFLAASMRATKEVIRQNVKNKSGDQ